MGHSDAIRNDLGCAVSNFLGEIVEDGDVIGVSWGTTLHFVVKHLEEYSVENIKVVQLNGGVTKNYLSTQSTTIMEKFVQAFHAVPYMLPVPAIVDSIDLARALVADSNVKQTLDLAREARIDLLGIGRVSEESILVQAGYFKHEEYDELLKNGSVGDICSRYFRLDGTIADQELNQRTVGITLDDLSAKEYTIGVANGEEKAEAIIGALRGRYINTLFIDEVAAQKCLELLKDR